MRLFVAAAALAFLAPPTHACSVQETYRIPTGIALVESADAILVGIVGREVRDKDPAGFGQSVVVRPLRMLKGAIPTEPVLIPGTHAERRFAVRSKPRELRAAHPVSFIGSCVRMAHLPGSTVVVFLKRYEGRLLIDFAPFARVAEDVSGADDLWVKAVRLYIEAAAQPVAARRGWLAAKRAALLARTNDLDAQALAADIDVELALPDPKRD